MKSVSDDVLFEYRFNSQIKSVAPCDHCVVCSCRWDLAMRWSAVNCVLNQYLPPITRLLQRIQIECDEIVEKVAFDLASEDVKLAAQNVQGMSVASWRARTCGKCAGPLFCCCSLSVSELRWAGFSSNLTCVEQVQGVVKNISLIHLGVTTENDESIADEQTGVADPGTGTF